MVDHTLWAQISFILPIEVFDPCSQENHTEVFKNDIIDRSLSLMRSIDGSLGSVCHSKSLFLGTIGWARKSLNKKAQPLIKRKDICCGNRILLSFPRSLRFQSCGSKRREKVGTTGR